jgi:hypothetical protein
VIDAHRVPAWTRLIAVAAIFTLVTAATCVVAHPHIFTGFAFYDDEGYLLISLESYLSGGSLYDEVFSQYGPFYYELWGGVFSLFGMGVSHDNGRLATLGVWVVASLLIGVATYRMTGSVLLGALTQVLVFAALGTVANEPMHPGGLTCLLVAMLVAISTAVRRETAYPAMALSGAVLGALVLVKANIGVFAVAALILTCTATYPALAGRRSVRGLIEAGFILTPLVLMAGEFDRSWVLSYCAHVTVAAVGVVILLRCRDPAPERDLRELAWLGGGLVAATVSICAVAVATGTSPAGLFEGVISRPLEQPGTFSFPLDLWDQPLVLVDLIALLAALAYWRFGHSRVPGGGTGWATLIALASIAVGVQLALGVIGFPAHATALKFQDHGLNFLAFAWVALVPVPGAADPGGSELARRLLPPLAALQALHAFPVAGSQVGWSVFLLVPVGAICIGNGVRGLRWAMDGRDLGRYLTPIGVAVALALIVFVGETTLRRPYDRRHALYERLEPLGLRGSNRIRLVDGDTDRFRRIAATLESRCSTFVALPGLNSFYLWSGKEPPTGLSPGDWMFLLNDEEQQRVVAATRSSPDPCLLENASTVGFWAQGRQLPDGPLLRFMRAEFTPASVFGPFDLLKLRNGTKG